MMERVAAVIGHPIFTYNMSKIEDNQRLEFLGDAVLELITSYYLYNEIKMPNFPSFFSDNKDNINKNKILENQINASINNLKIGNVNIANNPIKNNNKLNMLLNYMKPPSLINNLCSNFMSDYKLSLDNFLFPNTFGALPFNPNLKNNLILNSLNNKLNYFPLNMMEINNEINNLTITIIVQLYIIILL